MNFPYFNEFTSSFEYLLHGREFALIPVTSDEKKLSWQLLARNAAESSAVRPVRKYLWIRRPVHRPAHARAKHAQSPLVDIKPVQTLVLFSSFIAIAVCVAVFVH